MPVNDIYQNLLSAITFSYTLNGSNPILVETEIYDLEFSFTTYLCPRAHIDKVTSKAFKVLDFIKRISGEFQLTISLKSMYCALGQTTV